MIPLVPQLKYFIQHYGNNLERCNSIQISAEVGDVPTSRLYKKLQEEGIINDHTLSLQLNSVAAQIWKHSDYKFQPFMVLVNEAPYKVRRSNVGLVASWYGNKKNPRSVFLDPVVDSLNQIRRDGFIVDQIRYFIQPTITTVDSVERCEMNNTSQFNGESGCDWCLHPGIFKASHFLFCLLSFLLLSLSFRRSGQEREGFLQILLCQVGRIKNNFFFISSEG